VQSRPCPIGLAMRGLDAGQPEMIASALEHDPEKCEAVFRKDHAQTKT
jgi:hypothetical protein